MSSCTDDEWTILNPTAAPSSRMEVNTHDLPNKAETPNCEFTVNVKSPVDSKNTKEEECMCAPKPLLVRKDSIESIDEDYRPPRRGGRGPPPPRRYSVSPRRYPTVTNNFVDSATQLLAKVGKEDSLVDLPIPSRSPRIYISTYPFGNKDVQKWSWLLVAGIEDEYLVPAPLSAGQAGTSVERVSQRRSEFRTYDPGNVDIPSVYLSRALDTDVVPEDTEHSVRYLVVLQSRYRPAGSKLLVAESRKAAGIIMYYEVLKGDSIMFVGAVVHQCKVVGASKFKKVGSLEEAVAVQDEGYVGVVC